MTEKIFHKDQTDIFGEHYSGGDVARVVRSFDIDNTLTIIQLPGSEKYFAGINIAACRSLKEMMNTKVRDFKACDSIEAANAAAEDMKSFNRRC